MPAKSLPFGRYVAVRTTSGLVGMTRETSRRYMIFIRGPKTNCNDASSDSIHRARQVSPLVSPDSMEQIRGRRRPAVRDSSSLDSAAFVALRADRSNPHWGRWGIPRLHRHPDRPLAGHLGYRHRRPLHYRHRRRQERPPFRFRQQPDQGLATVRFPYGYTVRFPHGYEVELDKSIYLVESGYKVRWTPLLRQHEG